MVLPSTTSAIVSKKSEQGEVDVHLDSTFGTFRIADMVYICKACDEIHR